MSKCVPLEETIKDTHYMDILQTNSYLGLRGFFVVVFHLVFFGGRALKKVNVHSSYWLRKTPVNNLETIGNY